MPLEAPVTRAPLQDRWCSSSLLWSKTLKNGWFRKEIPNLATLSHIVISLKLLVYNFVVKLPLILMYLKIQMVDQSQYNCMLWKIGIHSY